VARDLSKMILTKFLHIYEILVKISEIHLGSLLKLIEFGLKPHIIYLKICSLVYLVLKNIFEHSYLVYCFVWFYPKSLNSKFYIFLPNFLKLFDH